MENKFTKIKAFGDRNNANVLDGRCELTEKLDGANGSVIIKDGVFILRSRNNELIGGLENGKNWARALTYLTEIHKTTPFVTGLIYFGEIMVKHTIFYGDAPAFIGYAVFDIEKDMYIEDWYTHFEERGIKTPTRVYVEGIPAIELIEIYGERKSEFGTEGAVAEGFVVKNYDNQHFAKYVREAFKEDNRKTFGVGERKEKQDAAFKIVERFATPSRINKAIHKLNEENGVEIEMKMMSELPKEVFSDILTEEYVAISTEYDMVSFGNMRKFVAKKCVDRLKGFMLDRA